MTPSNSRGQSFANFALFTKRAPVWVPCSWCSCFRFSVRSLLSFSLPLSLTHIHTHARAHSQFLSQCVFLGKQMNYIPAQYFQVISTAQIWVCSNPNLKAENHLLTGNSNFWCESLWSSFWYKFWAQRSICCGSGPK